MADLDTNKIINLGDLKTLVTLLAAAFAAADDVTPIRLHLTRSLRLSPLPLRQTMIRPILTQQSLTLRQVRRRM